jgi:hypothetical protein
VVENTSGVIETQMRDTWGEHRGVAGSIGHLPVHVDIDIVTGYCDDLEIEGGDVTGAALEVVGGRALLHDQQAQLPQTWHYAVTWHPLTLCKIDYGWHARWCARLLPIPVRPRVGQSFCPVLLPGSHWSLMGISEAFSDLSG